MTEEKKYVLTEDCLVFCAGTLSLMFDGIKVPKDQIRKALEGLRTASNSPLSSELAQAPCPQHKIWEHCPVVDKIRQDEREQVLDALILFLESLGCPSDICCQEAMKEKIQFLRIKEERK